MELLEAGGLADQHVLGDGIDLAHRLDRSTHVAHDVDVDEVERGEVGRHRVAAEGVVVPRAVLEDLARSAQRGDAQRGDALRHRVGEPAHLVDLRVELLVHRDEVGPTTFQCTCLRVRMVEHSSSVGPGIV